MPMQVLRLIRMELFRTLQRRRSESLNHHTSM